jgi:hypothetical protein
MKRNSAWELGPGVSILGAERIDDRWIILARQEVLGSFLAAASGQLRVTAGTSVISRIYRHKVRASQ